jgi:hypothetical protein
MALFPFVRKSIAFAVIVAVGVFGIGIGADAKGPNGGLLTVKVRERDCAITAVATFDKTLYQDPVSTLAIRFILVDEGTNPLEQQSYLYSSRDTQRISNTFSPLTPSSTPNTFAVEVRLLDGSGQPRFQGGSPDIAVNCQLPLIGF